MSEIVSINTPILEKTKVVHTDSELHERLSVYAFKDRGKVFLNITAEDSDKSTTVIAVSRDDLVAILMEF